MKTHKLFYKWIFIHIFIHIQIKHRGMCIDFI